MKRRNMLFIAFIAITMSFRSVLAQDYNITFAILGSSDKPAEVTVENTTQSTEATLNGSDVLNLVGGISSGVGSIDTETGNSLQVYPNPVGENATLAFSNPTAGKVTVKVINSVGMQVAFTSNILPKGEAIYTITGLNAGSYIVHVQSADFRSSCVILSQLVTGGSPGIEIIGTKAFSTQLAQQKSFLKSTKATSETVQMNYNAGDVLKFTATLDSKNAVVDGYTATDDAEIEFSFTYTITFNDWDDTEIGIFEGEFGEEITFPTHPNNRLGYIANGWSPENATVPANDMVISAQYNAISYSISYHNAGTKNAAGNPSEYTIETSDITLAAPMDSTGYTFGGWYTDASFTNSVNTPAIPLGSTGETSFFAKWVPISYSITYYNTGTKNAAGNPSEYTIETSDITLAAPMDSTGYTFGGWYTDASFTNSVNTPAIPLGSTGETSFYAKWVPTSYSITYYNTGTKNAAGNPSEYTIETSDITLVAPMDSIGCNFGGWYTDALFADSVNTPAIQLGSTGETSFYAKWVPISYSITYYNTGTKNAAGNPSEYTIETSDITLAAPMDSTDYTFDGWYTDASFTDTVNTPAITQGSTGNTSFYAKWVPTSYAITYYNIGTKNAAGNPSNYLKGTSDITLEAPKDSTGYIFGGWFTDAAFRDTVNTPAILQGSTGDTVFYAKWFDSSTEDGDGNIYVSVKIGEQVWMAENLRTTKYNNGTAIPLVSDNAEWYSLSTPAYCYYNNDSTAYSQTYGALYNWYTVNTGNVCPSGWHVSTHAEWTTLTTYLGGNYEAAGKLKETGTAHWNSPNEDATNETGFSALPGGYRFQNGPYSELGLYGEWWTATAFDATHARQRSISYNGKVYSTLNNLLKVGFSVRCVKD